MLVDYQGFEYSEDQLPAIKRDYEKLVNHKGVLELGEIKRKRRLKSIIDNAAAKEGGYANQPS